MHRPRQMPLAKGEYWKMDENGIVAELQTNLDKGLTLKEVQKRHLTYGKNSIPEKDKRSWLDILISQ